MNIITVCENSYDSTVLWCNGSTTGFGSVCRGSNPLGTTIISNTEINNQINVAGHYTKVY